METRDRYREFATVLEAVGDTAVVRVYGDVDISRGDEFEAAVTQAGAADLPVIIDLRDCKYMDSTGITILVRAFKQYGKRVQLVVTEGSVIARTLEIVALRDVMTIQVVKRQKRR